MSGHRVGGVLKVGALAGYFFASSVCMAAALGPAAGAETVKKPNFAPDDLTGWQLLDDEFIPPPSGAGPVVSDPAHPYVSFYRFPRNPKPTFRVADLTNPILQPWARERLRKVNERALTAIVMFTPKERCWPIGVPGFLLYPVTPVYFVQTSMEVVMIWEEDHMARHVYLTDKHSPIVEPSWFGESIGHYENGDTLVVDTIGLNTRTFVDSFRTPHTEQLHVVERFRIVEDGKALEVTARVDDPGAFTMSWTAVQRYRRAEDAPLAEES